MHESLCVAHHVSSQIDAEDGDGAQRQWDVDQDEEKERGDLWDVAGQSVSDRLFQVVKDQTACKSEGELKKAAQQAGKIVKSNPHLNLLS